MSGSKKVLVKIIIIGESGVGKTALLHQYVTGNFIIEHKSTIGADFHTSELNIDDKTITLQIWDTAGQERFQSLGNAFYRGADACILVYAINDESSFRQIEEWKSKFINQAGIDDPKQYPFLLLGNKADLDNGRSVSAQQGESYARQNGMAFYETSAKNGQNIEEAIKKIASIASDQPTVPFFHEDVVQKAMANYANNNDDAADNTDSGGGCACLLI
jgi:Ras-related protein Rab-7A